MTVKYFIITAVWTADIAHYTPQNVDLLSMQVENSQKIWDYVVHRESCGCINPRPCLG